MSEMIEAEETDLRTHVQLCAQRHAAVERRLLRIERAIWAAITGIVTLGAGGATWAVPVMRALAGH